MKQPTAIKKGILNPSKSTIIPTDKEANKTPKFWKK